MEFVNKKLGCKFSLPEPLRLRDVERYEVARDEARASGARFALSINWVGAAAILEEWECEVLPDPNNLTPDDLADAYGQILQIVVWVASATATHVINELFVPKN